MNMNRFLFVISILLLWLIKPSSAEKAVLPGVSFLSPNGRYCVQLDVIDRSLRFVIKDTETGRMDDSILSSGPLYLHWAGNSRSFVTVEHTAKGSYGRVVHLVGDKWGSVEVMPPFEGKMDANVINLQLGTDSVHYKFAVTRLAEDWTPTDYSFCDLDISLATGKVTNVKWTSASEAELVNAPGPDEPVCLPPMEQGTTATCAGDPEKGDRE
jgi:hypothetical protein